MGADLRAR